MPYHILYSLLWVIIQTSMQYKGSFYFFLVLTLSVGMMLNAQTTTQKPSLGGYYLEGTIGAGNQNVTLSPGITKLFALGKRWELGVGVRVTLFLGSNQRYITAPAILTTGSEGPQVLFLPNKPENIDSYRVANTTLGAVNVAFHARYHITTKWAIGGNIDLAGFSFGSSQDLVPENARIKSAGAVNASPSPYNILLVSDNDRGTLNSELYAQYSVNAHWGLRGGMGFLFTEFTTRNNQRNDNNRFRNKTTSVLLGVYYRF